MAYEPGTAVERLRLLLEELVAGKVADGVRGPKERAAEAVKLKQATFSKILNMPERGARIGSFETVVRALNLRWEYFFSECDPKTYRDFVGYRYDAYREFLRTEEGQGAEPDERAFLESAFFALGEPSAKTYSALLTAYRGHYAWDKKHRRLRPSPMPKAEAHDSDEAIEWDSAVESAKPYTPE